LNVSYKVSLSLSKKRSGVNSQQVGVISENVFHDGLSISVKVLTRINKIPWF